MLSCYCVVGVSVGVVVGVRVVRMPFAIVFFR